MNDPYQSPYQQSVPVQAPTSAPGQFPGQPGTPGAPGAPGAPGQYPAWQHPGPAPIRDRGNGLAIAALVLSVVAILMVIGLAILVTAVGFIGGSAYTLNGTAPQVVAGQAYPGARLESEIHRVIEYDGGTVESVSCPTSVHIDADADTACDATVDGADYRVTATFEDDEGHFTLAVE